MDESAGIVNLLRSLNDMSHAIHFVLDGEQEVTHEHELTPNFIILKFGMKDPASHYLIALNGKHKEKTSYQGLGEVPIKMHDHLRFQIISTGPTPVSDVNTSALGSFVAGLRALGYDPAIIDATHRRITFEYFVETGRHAGKSYKHGFEVPQDFPLTPPSGPHVNAVLHLTGRSGTHPDANISDSGPFGSGWQYWSRPFPDWANSKKTVGTYMAHIFRLWDSQ